MIFIVSSHSDCKGNYNMQLELVTKVPRCSARVTAMQLINGFTMELIDRQSKVFKNLKAIDQAELAFVFFCFFFLVLSKLVLLSLLFDSIVVNHIVPLKMKTREWLLF